MSERERERIKRGDTSGGRRRRAVMWLVLLSLGMGGALLSLGRMGPWRGRSRVGDGAALPDVALEEVDGTRRRLAEALGQDQGTILVFVNTECGHCASMLRTLGKALTELGPIRSRCGLLVFAEGPIAVAQQFLAEGGERDGRWFRDGGTIRRELGIDKVPTLLLVNGRRQAVRTLEGEKSDAYLREELTRHCAP